MIIIRYQYQKYEGYGLLEDDMVFPVEGDIYGQCHKGKEKIPFSDVKVLPPCQPSKVVCVGLNYHDHAKEMNLELPKEPLIFLKPPSSVIADGDGIEYPPFTQNLHYEAELAVVIGKKAKCIKEEDAAQYIFGYTCANDVTARDLQHKDGQWTRGKSFDTFLPLGPCIVTELRNDAEILLELNGEVRQKSHIGNLIFSVPYIVAFVSQVMTLFPGDVIITGTPAGVGPMNVGDRVIVSISGIGRLENQVVSK